MTSEVIGARALVVHVGGMDDAVAWRVTSAVGALYALVGFVFVVVSFDDATLRWMNTVLVPDPSPPTSAVRLYAAVLGAVVLGLGVMLGRVASAAERGPSAIARALRDGLVAWFVVDTGASLLHGSLPNVVFNVISLTAGLAPILLLLRGARRRAARAVVIDAA